eukprot:scaffold39025_cov20-Tisochrysis_lutea.AAC.2
MPLQFVLLQSVSLLKLVTPVFVLYCLTCPCLECAPDAQAASSSMVCCAAFDRDDEYFATVGVAKRIRIYELSSLVASGANPVLGACQGEWMFHYMLAYMYAWALVSGCAYCCVSWCGYVRIPDFLWDESDT